jgi:drug/metabolite transporter (DMT)-like permease
MGHSLTYIWLALTSVLLWATVATFGHLLGEISAFFLIGAGLAIGSLLGLGNVKEWFKNLYGIAIGTLGFFGYHFFLFMALRKAPAVEANLINYTWPIFIVLFSALSSKQYRLKWNHIVGAVMAFVGAALAISGGSLLFRAEYLNGYLLAFGAAICWAVYSVMLKLSPRVTSAQVGGACLVSSILAFGCYFLFDEPVTLQTYDLFMIAVLGVGPMGIAFYTWDASLRRGDPRVVGAISYITPLLSTLLLTSVIKGNVLSWATGVALVLIIGGACLSSLDLFRKGGV